ncbi:MAG: hypothetical protein ACYDDF_09570 [Thermoplasmatota archaeon]
MNALRRHPEEKRPSSAVAWAVGFVLLSLLIAPVSAQFSGSGSSSIIRGPSMIIPGKEFSGSFVNGLGSGGYASILQGVPSTLYAFVSSQSSAELSGHVSLSVPGWVPVNRTSAPFHVASGQHVLVPFLFSVPSNETRASFVAWGNVSWDGLPPANNSFQQTIGIIPPISVNITTPPPSASPSAQTGERDVSWTIEFPIRANITNYGTTPSAPFHLTLWGPSSGPDVGPLANVTVESIPAGASRTVTLMSLLGPRDLPQFGPAPGQVSWTAGFYFSPRWDLTYAQGYKSFQGTLGDTTSSFRVVGGELSSFTSSEAYFVFHAGVDVELAATHIVANQASWIVVGVTNYGSDAISNLRVDVLITPTPLAYYGPSSYYQTTTYVTVPGTANRSVNLTWVPKVAGSLTITVRPYLANSATEIQSQVDLPSPVSINITDGGVVAAGIGQSFPISFAFNSTKNMTGARIRYAVTTQGSPFQVGVPYSTFITGDELFDGLAGPSITFHNNTNVSVNATLLPKAAGTFLIVPYIDDGGLVYIPHPIVSLTSFASPVPLGGGPVGLSQGGSTPGIYTISVKAGDYSPLLVWFPAAAIVFLAVAGAIYRRKFVP